MEDDVTSVTAEEFAAWLTPQAAVSRASQAFGNEATGAIWARLTSGFLKAAASHSSQATPPNAEPRLTLSPTIIPARYWGQFSNSNDANFWRAGDARFFFPPNRPRVEFATVILCFGIRLNPADIDTLFPPLPVEPQPESNPAAESDVERADPGPKGPAVSPDHLQAWFDLYQRAYTGSADTEAMAVKSAIGMFPGKHVSRDRVRDLRGAQKRGRKPTDN